MYFTKVMPRGRPPYWAKFSGYQYGGRPLGITFVKYMNAGPAPEEMMEGQGKTRTKALYMIWSWVRPTADSWPSIISSGAGPAWHHLREVHERRPCSGRNDGRPRVGRRSDPGPDHVGKTRTKALYMIWSWVRPTADSWPSIISSGAGPV
jgi:hypothetical protein